MHVKARRTSALSGRSLCHCSMSGPGLSLAASPSHPSSAGVSVLMPRSWHVLLEPGLGGRREACSRQLHAAPTQQRRRCGHGPACHLRKSMVAPRQDCAEGRQDLLCSMEMPALLVWLPSLSTRHSSPIDMYAAAGGGSSTVSPAVTAFLELSERLWTGGAPQTGTGSEQCHAVDGELESNAPQS